MLHGCTLIYLYFMQFVFYANRSLKQLILSSHESRCCEILALVFRHVILHYTSRNFGYLLFSVKYEEMHEKMRFTTSPHGTNLKKILKLDIRYSNLLNFKARNL